MHGILPMEQINSLYAIKTKRQARNATGRVVGGFWCIGVIVACEI